MNTNETETWLTESMRAATTGVTASEDLLAESVADGARRRRHRRVMQGVGVAATVLAIGALVVTSGVLPDQSNTTADTLSDGVALADLYFATPNREHIAAVPTVITATGDPGFDAVRALMIAEPADTNLRNGFTVLFSQPIAEVNAVESTDELITIDLSGVTRDPEGYPGFTSPSGFLWDPYPTVDCDCGGEILMQQLVWTAQSALRSDAPVLLLEDGKPAKGLWLYELNGPVRADEEVEVSSFEATP